MPPYASEQDSSLVVSTARNNDNIFRQQDFGTVDASIQKDAATAATSPGVSPSLSQDTQDTDDTNVSSFSRFDKLLDLNPCMISFSSGSAATKFAPATTSSSSSGRNLSPSAVFKKRQCLECKKCCSKFKFFQGGYEVERVTTSSGASLLDEEIDETLGSTTKKVYYHKQCAQIKQYRNDHYNQGGFAIVLKDLMDRSRAIELEKAEQKQMEEEEAIRLEAAREKNERSCLEEDDKKKMKSGKNKKKLTTKKFLKHVKNNFSSCKGRNGTTNAVILSGDYQEYLDIKTSRMYYSDGVNTMWNKPESYNPYKA